nr:ClpX C4-type zinc finger protein [Lachnoclostridium phytofermentans]
MSNENNKDNNLDNNEDQNKYEEICYICRRPESKAGKMIHVPGNICICQNCMQKTFDTMNNGNNPYMDMSALNPAMMGYMMQQDIPNRQKIKKRAEEPAKKNGGEGKRKSN